MYDLSILCITVARFHCCSAFRLITSSQFICSAVDRIWIVSSLGLLWVMLLRTFLCMSCVPVCVSVGCMCTWIHIYISLEGKSLAHRVCIPPTLVNSAKLFSRVIFFFFFKLSLEFFHTSTYRCVSFFLTVTSLSLHGHIMIYLTSSLLFYSFAVINNAIINIIFHKLRGSQWEVFFMFIKVFYNLLIKEKSVNYRKTQRK